MHGSGDPVLHAKERVDDQIETPVVLAEGDTGLTGIGQDVPGGHRDTMTVDILVDGGKMLAERDARKPKVKIPIGRQDGLPDTG